jgi:putative ABC transport system permease protein
VRPVKLFPPTLFRVAWRYVIRHPLQTGLLITGITLGVAVVVAIDVANASASQAFDLSVESVAGRATHQIVAGPDGIDEALYVGLKRQGVPVPIAPVITEFVSSAQLDDIPMQLLGVDPFAEPPFRNYLGATDLVASGGLTSLLTQPNSILISTSVAQRFGLGLNDKITLTIGGKDRRVEIVGMVRPPDELTKRALDGLIITDIATAQELTGRIGRIDRIDLIVQEADQDVVGQIASQLPVGVRITAVSARTGTLKQMTDAFRLNLTALSLLALVVGMFLIYNTMTFSVVQRRQLFGTLRCLGVTRREIFALIIGEALIVAFVGTGLGLILGVVLGQSAVQAVIGTINDLYFTITVQGVQVPPVSLIKGGLIGIGATVLTALPPAQEASTVPARSALVRSGLETKARKAISRVAIVGFLFLLIAAAVLSIPTHDLVVSFAGTFLTLLGCAMLSPRATVVLMEFCAPILGRIGGNTGRMAPRNVIRSSSRTTIAVAALMIAVSVTIGISVMIGSFRSTVIAWLAQTLQSDIYISVPNGTVTQPLLPIDPQIIDVVQRQPGVSRIDSLRSVVVDSPTGPIQISATSNFTVAGERIYVRAERPITQMWSALQGGAVLVTGPLANQLDLPGNNAAITLYTDQGPRRFPVVGVVYDYSSSQGSVLMAQNIYHKLWKDAAITALGIRLASGSDADTVATQIQTAVNPIQHLSVQPNQKLRKEVLTVFDRTFAITGALQLLATLVAFVGVLSAFLALGIERQREIGILRTVGMTIRQVWGLIMLESGLMGAAAGALAMPTGLVLAWILTYIINRRSFGWTLQMSVAPAPFVEALLIALTAALLAGLYPANRISHLQPAEAIHFE